MTTYYATPRELRRMLAGLENYDEELEWKIYNRIESDTGSYSR